MAASSLGEASSKDEFVAALAERGLPTAGWCRLEPGSGFEFVALPDAWQSRELTDELLAGLASLFQYDKRVEQEKFKLMRSPAFKAIAAEQLKDARWGFYPVDNPQGVHITIAAGSSPGDGRPPPAVRAHSAAKAAPDCQFRVTGLRGVSDGRTEPLPFNPLLWCARRFVLTVEILNDRVLTQKPAHITIGCYGIKLQPTTTPVAAKKKPAKKAR